MHAPPVACAKLAERAAPAVKHAAALLGAVAYAANNWTVQVVEPDGQVHKKVMRDADPAPRRQRRHQGEPSATPYATG